MLVECVEGRAIFYPLYNASDQVVVILPFHFANGAFPDDKHSPARLV